MPARDDHHRARTPVQPRQERGTELSEQPAPLSDAVSLSGTLHRVINRQQRRRAETPCATQNPPASKPPRRPLTRHRPTADLSCASSIPNKSECSAISRRARPRSPGSSGTSSACRLCRKFAAPRLRSLPERQYLTLWRGRAGPEGKNDVSTQTLSGVSGGGWCWWPRGDDCPWSCDRTDAQVPPNRSNEPIESIPDDPRPAEPTDQRRRYASYRAAATGKAAQGTGHRAPWPVRGTGAATPCTFLDRWCRACHDQATRRMTVWCRPWADSARTERLLECRRTGHPRHLA